MLVIVLVLILCYVSLFFFKKKSVFHPTLSYPGRIPLLGNLLSIPTDPTKAVENIHELSMQQLHNVIITLGTKEFLVLTEPNDAAKILNSNSEKGMIYEFAKPWIGDGLITSSNAVWNQHRKIVYPMFSQNALNSYMGVFNSQGRRMVDNFAAKVGKGPFDHRPFVVKWGLELICQTALGLDITEQNQIEIDAYAKAIDGMMVGFVRRFQNVLLYSDFVYNWSSLKKSVDSHLEVLHSMTEKVIDNKMAESLSYGAEYKTIADHLVQALMNNTMSRQEVREELNTIVAAGYDSTAHELLFVLMLLGSHQDMQDKVYEEIQEVIGDRDVDRSDLSKLVYLEAFLKETLRLYPVVPILGRVTVDEVQLKSCTVPPGSHCFVLVYAVNRHSCWGPDAAQFRPERWLDPASLPATGIASFSLGRRSCVGKVYAMMSLKTIVVHLLRHFRLSADMSEVVLKLDPVLRPAKGQHLIVEPR